MVKTSLLQVWLFHQETSVCSPKSRTDDIYVFDIPGDPSANTGPLDDSH